MVNKNGLRARGMEVHVALPFWQRSLSSLGYDDLAAFIDERAPEGEHLEYKQPSYNGQSKKVELSDQLLETLVAFANGGGGMLVLGVAESDDKDNRPAPVDAIMGVGLSAHKGAYRLEQALLDACADRIEPPIVPEARPIMIPDDEPGAGNIVLLARVRTGLLPPYNLRKKGIYVRIADADRLAGVREIEALFQRRVGLAPGDAEETGWERALRNVFVPAGAARRERPPFVMCALTPAFPIEPIVVDQRGDDFFARLCLTAFAMHTSSALLRLADGVVFDPSRLPNAAPYGPYPPYACAYGDGAIGLQWTFGLGDPRSPDTPQRLDVIGTWQFLRKFVVAAATWPRALCGYEGPLTCRIALGNIDNTIMVAPDAVLGPAARLSSILNSDPQWLRQIEWSRDEPIDDVLAEMMASLARQLQFPYFHGVLPTIRPLAERD